MRPSFWCAVPPWWQNGKGVKRYFSLITTLLLSGITDVTPHPDPRNLGTRASAPEPTSQYVAIHGGWAGKTDWDTTSCSRALQSLPCFFLFLYINTSNIFKPVVDVPGTFVEQAEEMCSPFVSLALIGVCWVQILILLMALLVFSLSSFQHFRQTLRRRCETGSQDTAVALLGASDCICAYDCSSGWIDQQDHLWYQHSFIYLVVSKGFLQCVVCTSI